MLEQKEARDQEVTDMQAAVHDLAGAHAKEASQAIYELSKAIKKALRRGLMHN